MDRSDVHNNSVASKHQSPCGYYAGTFAHMWTGRIHVRTIWGSLSSSLSAWGWWQNSRRAFAQTSHRPSKTCLSSFLSRMLHIFYETFTYSLIFDYWIKKISQLISNTSLWIINFLTFLLLPLMELSGNVQRSHWSALVTAGKVVSWKGTERSFTHIDWLTIQSTLSQEGSF